MLAINMDDVKAALSLCAPYLIGFAVVAVLLVIAMIVCRKMDKGKKALIRGESALALVLALVVTVNLVCFGPMSNMINLAMGGGSISAESSAEVTALCTDIAEEGIVLLKNDGGLLPLASDASLNVFGWASTNPWRNRLRRSVRRLSHCDAAPGSHRCGTESEHGNFRFLHRLPGRPAPSGHFHPGLDPA